MKREEFGTRFRALRERLGFTQMEIAGKVGVSQQAVQRWEDGKALPHSTKLDKIAGVFGITVSELINKSPGDATAIIKGVSTGDLLPVATSIHELSESFVDVVDRFAKTAGRKLSETIGFLDAVRTAEKQFRQSERVFAAAVEQEIVDELDVRFADNGFNISEDIIAPPREFTSGADYLIQTSNGENAVVLSVHTAPYRMDISSRMSIPVRPTYVAGVRHFKVVPVTNYADLEGVGMLFVPITIATDRPPHRQFFSVATSRVFIEFKDNTFYLGRRFNLVDAMDCYNPDRLWDIHQEASHALESFRDAHLPR